LTNTGAVNCDCQRANSGALEASSHGNYSAMCDAPKKKQSTEKLKLAIGVLKCLIHIKSWSHKNSSVALLPAEN